MRLYRAIITITLVIASTLSAMTQINTDQVMSIGRNALFFEDYLLAIQYFNQAIEAKPHLGEPYYYRALAKLNLEDYEGAAADASACIERNPFISDVYEVRGVARQGLRNYQGAVDDYNQALVHAPHNHNMMFYRAAAQLEMGDTVAATSTFTELIDANPRYANAYLGRARVLLAHRDTTLAMADIDRALSLNPNMTNAHIMRAEILMTKRNPDYREAIANLNAAIKMRPQNAELYLDRALARYHIDDYRGAITDFDYAVELDPFNPDAYFYRGLMRAKVKDRDRAIRDFSEVLKLVPGDQRALYMRMTLYHQGGQLKTALADINTLLKKHADMPDLLYRRAEIKALLGDKNGALADDRRADALAKRVGASGGKLVDSGEHAAAFDPTVAKFTNAVRLSRNNNAADDVTSLTNNHGKLQERDRPIAVEAMFMPSYYANEPEFKGVAYYTPELEAINATRALPYFVSMSNSTIHLQQSDIDKQFKAIEDFDRRIEVDPRAIDYLGRAIAECILHNYPGATADLDHVIELQPALSIAWLQRGVAKHHNATGIESAISSTDAKLAAQQRMAAIDDAIADFDRAAELSPDSPFPLYNKGVALIDAQRYIDAIDMFTRTIELTPDFGEAYYNRGYANLKIGRRDQGLSDLSKAGELGIATSYNLMKRMRD